MNQKPKIVWLCDKPGWAYDNRAIELSKRLPEYEHIRLYYQQLTLDQFCDDVAGADIVVAMHPNLLKYFDDARNVVLCMTGQRPFANRERAIIYYTDNSLDGTELDKNVKQHLSYSAGDIPIISVSQQPIELGKNVCVGKKPRNHESIFEQILAGFDEVSDDTYVFLVEHDCLYHESHFADAPVETSKRNQVNYNINCYRCMPDGYARRKNIHKILSQCSGLAGALKSAIIEKLYLVQHGGQDAIGRLEPGTGKGCTWVDVKSYESKVPTVDVRHDKNFTMLIHTEIQCETLPYWRNYKTLREGLGV